MSKCGRKRRVAPGAEPTRAARKRARHAGAGMTRPPEAAHLETGWHHGSEGSRP